MRPRIVSYLDALAGAGWLVPDYALLYALAMLLGGYLAIRAAEREGLDAARVFRIGAVTIVAALVGSRLFVVAQYAGYFIEHPLEVFDYWNWGTASTGAYIGGMAGALLACRAWRFPALRFLDLAAPSVALAIVLGRIGCFLNGCCYGALCDLPWGVGYPAGSGAHEAHQAAHLIGAGGLSLPVHPTQLYEALYCSVLFALLLLYRRRPRRDGELIALLFLFYPLGRFLNEFLRADDRGMLGIISYPQALALVAMGISSIVLLRSFLPRRGELGVSANSTI